MKKRVWNKSTGRDYDYDTAYESTPKQKKRRAARNAARRKMMAIGRVHRRDGMDVHHVAEISKGNSLRHLMVLRKSKNRSIK